MNATMRKAQVDARSRELIAIQERNVALWADQLFATLLIVQWLGAIGLAIWVSPWAWEGDVSRVHFHVWTAIALGAAIVSLPMTLAITRPGLPSTRYAVAIGQMLIGALWIHLSGGRIETHFHIFGSLALLAFYRDWKVLLVASIVVVFDHLLRNILWPRSIFGVVGVTHWRWAEHSAYVVFEDIFLIRYCLRGVAETREIALRQAELEATRDRIDQEVRHRTAELRVANEQLTREIDKRNRVEVALRASEAEASKLAMVASRTDNGVIITDAAGRIEWVNDGFTRISEFRLEEVIGRKLGSFLHGPRTDADSVRMIRERLVKGESFKAVILNYSKSGREYWLEKDIQPIRDASGTMIHFVAIDSDITERKLFEAELEQAHDAVSAAELRYRSLYEQSTDALVTLDPSTLQFLSANPAAIAMFGAHDEANFISKTPWQRSSERQPDGGNSAELTRQIVEVAVREGSKFFEWTCERIDGTLFRSTILLTRIDCSGKTILQATIRDVTLEKQAEQKAKELMAELDRSNKELEQFAYVASHDLQEPLRMVSSYTQLLSKRYKGRLDADADEFIAYAVDGANRMQGLINDLLAYSRVGTLGKVFKPTNCAAIFKQTLVNLRGAIEQSGAVVDSDMLPTVMADQMQIGQLLQNLIGNAIKYNKAESPRVHVSAEHEGKDWLISVHDNGIGIDPQYADRIFVVFQRLHSREEYPGTGIGLAICKKIVERHGGHIGMKSHIGSGSTFYFTLPAENHET
jgi:PAS domain S-box-containing protein